MKKFIAMIVIIAMIFSTLCVLASCDAQVEKGDKGDTGAQGEKGDKGDAGATIEKIEYDEQGRLVITLTDGTVLDPVELPKQNGTDGLAYYPLPDGTYGVMAGTTSYLSHVEIPTTYGGKTVTQILPNAFQNATNLTSVTIPDSVTSIGEYAFSGCKSLTSIIIPDGVTSIAKWTFSGCSGLTSVTIPESVTIIDNSAFSDCYNLTSITVDVNNTVYHSDGNCLIETQRKILILGCKYSLIPSDGSVMSIGDAAFAYGSSPTTITIPDGVTSIGNWAFDGCGGLNQVTIPDSVTHIGYRAFYDCRLLTSIYFKGTEAQWNAISKGADWDSNIIQYTVHYAE